jgi:predicted Zn-dependent protease
LPLLTRLAAYGELVTRDPGLQPHYFGLLQQAARELPSDPLVLAALGNKALADGRPEAVEWLSSAVSAGSAAATTWIDLSEALSRAGRDAEAVATLERGQTSFPFSQPLRKRLILAYIRGKQYQKAREAMGAFLSDFPEDSLIRDLLARAPR